MAGNWQMARNSRWARLPSMAETSGFCLSQTSADFGRPTLGCPERSDTRSLEGRSSTASLHCPSGVQNRVGGVAGEGAPGKLPGPGVHGHHHLDRGLHLLVRVFVEGAVADSQVAVFVAEVAVYAPEAVLLLAPQYPLGSVETGVGDGGPGILSVAGHGVVEPAVPEQPEVGHPDFS